MKWKTPWIFLALILVLALPSRADEGKKITAGDFTCELPLGWRQVDHPPFVFAAVSSFADGRFFAVTVETKSMCPIPCEIADESAFEKGFWKRFESNFSSTSHCMITDRGFRIINGVPFRIFDGTRESTGKSSGLSYLEIAVTPGNGKIYELAAVKKGMSPGSDRDLQAMMNSFAFTTPPRIAWYQPLFHYADEVIGLPLLLVVIVMGIYILSVRRRADVAYSRKANVTGIAVCLAMLNANWIAGLESVTGIISMLIFGTLIWQLQGLTRERKKQIKLGEVAAPEPRKLRRIFWILAAAMLFGLATEDTLLALSGTPAWIILSATAFTLVFIAVILWAWRRRAFPKTDSSGEPKSS